MSGEYQYMPYGYGPPNFRGSYGYNGFVAPMPYPVELEPVSSWGPTRFENLQHDYYHHEMQTEGMVRFAKFGALAVGGVGLTAGLVKGITAGGLVGGPVGALVGGLIGAGVGLAAGGAFGKFLGGHTAIEHDSHDDGILNGSPLAHHGGGGDHGAGGGHGAEQAMMPYGGYPMSYGGGYPMMPYGGVF